MQLRQPQWQEYLQQTLKSDSFNQLKRFVEQEYQSKTPIYPPQPLIFRAFELTPPSQVKVVILGQDPYHGPNQAHGLAFSVPDGEVIPPSLKNIYKELHTDLQQPHPASGNLESWAKQGVLLLNTILTVQHKQAHSHKKSGWEDFTDSVIQSLNQAPHSIVYLLWGAHAQAKSQLIDSNKHTILEAPHPSPLSAHRGFFGCRHFSKTNQILKANGQSPINWVHSGNEKQQRLFN